MSCPVELVWLVRAGDVWRVREIARFSRAQGSYGHKLPTVFGVYGATGETKALEEAIAIYSQVIDRKSDCAEALRGRGLAYYSFYKTDLAEADLVAAVALDPTDNVRALNNNLYNSWTA